MFGIHTALAATKMDNRDPLQILPAELFQHVLEYLPLSDHWRLRQVSKTWMRYFLSWPAGRHVFARWNGRARNARLPLERPSAVFTHSGSTEAIKSLLSGRPLSLAIIEGPDRRPRPRDIYGPGIHTPVLEGDWVAYRTSDEDQCGMHWEIEAYNLATGSKFSYDGNWPKYTCSFLAAFTLSTNLIAFTMSDNNDEHFWYDDTVITVDLADFSERKWKMSDIARAGYDLQLQADKGCVVCLRQVNEEPVGLVEFFDTTNDCYWSFLWSGEPARRIYTQDGWCVHSVDVERKIVTIWSIAFDIAAPLCWSAQQSRCIVAIERFDFDGTLLYDYDFEVTPTDLDLVSLSATIRHCFIEVSRAGPGDVWDVTIRLRTSAQYRLFLRVDLGQRPPVIHAFNWNHHFTLKTWRDVAIHCDERGVLHTGRFHTSASPSTLALSKRFVQEQDKRFPNQRAGFNIPDVIGVNDRYLVVASKDRLWVHSFNPVAGYLELTAAQNKNGERQDETCDRIVWRSTKGLFSADATADPLDREKVHADASGLLQVQMLHEKPYVSLPRQI